MFTIDLLDGQGVPVKSRPESIVIASVTFAVPTVIAIAILGYYLRTRVVISVQKQEIVRVESEINKLSDAVELQRTFEQEKTSINNCLAEALSSTSRHFQWTPVLITLVENLPDSVMLTDLEVQQRSVKRKVPQKNDPTKMVNVTVPVQTLKLNISGRTQSNSDNDVRDFRERLLSSAFLGPKLEDIRVSQESGKLGSQDVISYEIDCIFKPQL